MPVATGLPSVNYQLGRREDFTRLMSRALRGQPALAGLVSPDPADATRAFVDAWATSLDVLAFYQARLADGHYLGTATEPDAVRRLATQVGYRPAPPIASTADIAFFIDDADGSARTVKIPLGTKIQSVPGADELPQTYETLEEVTAFRDWNRIPIRRLAMNDTWGDVYRFAGVSTDLKVGDVILFVAEDTIADISRQHYDVRHVKSVTRVPEDDALEVTIDSGLNANVAAQPKAFKVRSQAASFGYNAISSFALTDEQRNDISGSDTWNANTMWAEGALSGFRIDLDAHYSQLTAGGYAVFTGDGTSQLVRINSLSDVSVSRFFLSGKVSRLSLSDNLDENAFGRRNTLIYLDTIPLTIAPVPMDTPVGYREGDFSLTHIDLDRQRPVELPPKLIISGKPYRMRVRSGRVKLFNDEGIVIVTLVRGDEIRILAFHVDPVTQVPVRYTVVTDNEIVGFLTGDSFHQSTGPNDPEPETDFEFVVPHHDDPEVAQTIYPAKDQSGAELYEVVIDPPINAWLYRPSAVVYGNIAAASHGETRDEVIGSGDGRAAFPQFTLRAAPLTYLPVASAAGAQPEIKVYVNDIEWKPRQTLYDATARDRAFVVKERLDGKTSVQFGDGENGSRLPTGSENVRARYRTGGGAAGRVRQGQLKLLLNKPLGLKAALNPAASQGGSDGEEFSAIKLNAPAFTRSLRRIVSLEDLEDFARRFPGVDKAQVDLLWNGNRQVAHLTVASPVVNGFDLEKLRLAVDDARDPHFPVVIQPGRIIRFALRVEVRITEGYLPEIVLAAVKDSLKQAFSFESRAFSEAVTTSEVAAAAHRIAGVTSVRTVDLREIIAEPGVVDPVRARPARYDDATAQLKPAELLLVEPTQLITEVHRDL
jgi:hypothetical protein